MDGDRQVVEEFVRELDQRLRIYGSPRHGNKVDPLEELVYILLSAQTEEYSYVETYEALAREFPGWRGVSSASEEKIAAVIHRGGLSRKKAKQLRAAIGKIESDFGDLSLAPLRQMDDETAESYLLSLPGVGVKSAKCILMYSLDRAVLPVDTHTWRVSRRLGLTPQVPKPTTAMEKALEAVVPSDVRFSFHVNLVSHGRATCLTYWPKCHSCIIGDLCPSAFQQDAVWGTWRRPKGAWAKAVESTSSAENAAYQQILPHSRKREISSDTEEA